MRTIASRSNTMASSVIEPCEPRFFLSAGGAKHAPPPAPTPSEDVRVYEPHSTVRGQTLAEGKLHALLPRSRTRFLAGRQATPTQLQQWHRSAPMIGLFDNNPVWLAFSRHCENHGLNPQPAIRVETSGLAEDIVALGEAWTVADPLSAARAHADVFAVPLTPAVPCPLIAFRHEDAPPNTLATRFTDIAAGLLGTLHVGAA